MSLHERSIKERLFHALLFEVLAIGISAPLAAWITGQTMLSMGILTAVIATIAVLWNMTYNWLFDNAQNRYKFERNLWVRVIHSIGFELGLIVAVIPLVAWWINTSLLHALILDIGLVLFYLPYAFFFNLAYDKVRIRLMG